MTKSAIQTQAESRLRKAITTLEKIMPTGIGIAIFVFERNTDKGNIGYVANAERQGMRRALAEFLAKWDAEASGTPFHPLTLEAFEAYAIAQMRDDLVEAIDNYRRFSNEGPTLPSDVVQQ